MAPPPRFPVLAVTLPHRPTGRAFLLGYRPSRITVLASFPGGSPRLLARAAAREARPDATLVTDAKGPAGEELRAELTAARSADTLLAADPGALLRFFWCYRDAHDPLALGHASDRTLFAPGYFARTLPDPRRAQGRAGRAKELERLRGLVLDTGAVLGVRPPLPAPGARGWGRERRLRLLETCLLYYAGLLSHWGSPLAVSPSPGRLALADRWLRERAGMGKA